MNRCQCGCGGLAKNRFINGHNKRKNAEQRFWEKVDKRGPGDCWEWQGYHGGRYGSVSVTHNGDTRTTGSHRFSHELHNGPIPEGMYVCHSCDNPPCVNPAHLFLGTNADNLEDMVRKGRSLAGSKNKNARLAENDIRDIRGSYRMRKGPELAKKYGVADCTIRDIVRGRRWRHV